MKTLQLYLLFFILIVVGIAVGESTSQAHPVSGSIVNVVSVSDNANQSSQGQSAQQGLSASNLWTLSEQAGPLRWPIFAVFLLGMFLVFYKLYELLADARESREIEDMEFRLMNVPQLIRAVSGQRESMISRLHANMLNVFQSQQLQADLHDEIANYIQFQQDRFDTFKRRIDFLSDTAGALGLLGTVWGIFAVFSQGLLDDQIILSGMGVALISTLLGLVVSIILNLSSTEIFSYFNKRLDRIAEKSDELRFRLMELTTGHEEMPEAESFMPDFAPPAMVSTPALKAPVDADHDEEDETQINNNNNVIGQLEAKPIAQVEAVFEDRFSNNSYGDSAATTVRKPLVESSVEYPSEPHDLSLISPLDDALVGKKVRDLCFLLVDENGDPVSNRQVKLEVVEGGSVLNGEEQHTSIETNENGEVHFDIQVAKRAGKQVITAQVLESDAPSTKVTHTFLAKAGVPRKLKQFGNNQGGAAGEILSKALKVQVLDEFENPIPEWMVTFKVDLGGGMFDNDEPEVKIKTNLNGEGIAHFRVGNDPGFNTVRAAVEGVVKELKFQAMSMA